jgi:hypothetical protein
MNAAMTRGVFLETDILDIYEEYSGIKLIRQGELRHYLYPYCQAHCDGVNLDNGLIIEVKTSIHASPDNVSELSKNFPNYMSQVQWQLWLENEIKTKPKAIMLWCKVPDDNNSSAYDIDGQLDISMIELNVQHEYFNTFETNAPEFWRFWERIKNTYDEHLEKCIDTKEFNKIIAEIVQVEQAEKLRRKAVNNGIKA